MQLHYNVFTQQPKDYHYEKNVRYTYNDARFGTYIGGGGRRHSKHAAIFTAPQHGFEKIKNKIRRQLLVGELSTPSGLAGN